MTRSPRQHHGATESLGGYKHPNPMVYAGLYPIDGDDYPTLRDALEKLQLNDAALTYEPETSGALGFGFRCGFLGLLHMEITRDRLEREFDLDLISTAPNVVYEVVLDDGTEVEVTNPSEYPDGKIAEVREPVVKATILAPSDYIGTIMELCQLKRGNLQGMDYLSEDRVEMRYTLPMGEIVFDFFDQLKSRTKGYASLDYERSGEQAADLVKVDILLQGEPVDAFSAIVHRDAAYSYGVMMAGKLKDLIPRQQFEVPIQAAIGARVIARETIRAIRKDVLAKCYGGDISRKRKLLEKQKAGKKRMKNIGSRRGAAGGLRRRALHHAADGEDRQEVSRVVRSDEVTPQAWANGGGTTRELAVADDGAWRISLADVDRDGPFSTFPGRQRLLTLVEGPVLDLEVDGDAHVVEPQRPFAFSGDATAVASVPEGPVRVLNVVVDPTLVHALRHRARAGPLLDLPAGRRPGGVRLSGGRDGLATGTPRARPRRGGRPLHGRRRHPAALLTRPRVERSPGGRPTRMVVTRMRAAAAVAASLLTAAAALGVRERADVGGAGRRWLARDRRRRGAWTRWSVRLRFDGRPVDRRALVSAGSPTSSSWGRLTCRLPCALAGTRGPGSPVTDPAASTRGSGRGAPGQPGRVPPDGGRGADDRGAAHAGRCTVAVVSSGAQRPTAASRGRAEPGEQPVGHRGVRPTSTASAHTPSECRAAPQPSAVACRSAASASLTDHS